MEDESNWVNLLRHPQYDMGVLRSIMDDPQRLEVGLLLFPSDQFKELHSDAKSETSALFLDKKGTPVFVVCVPKVPGMIDLKRIRRKMSRLKAELGVPLRGILVWGGMRLHGEKAELGLNVIEQSYEVPRVEIIHYNFEVDYEKQGQR
jgi:hypothetical protein